MNKYYGLRLAKTFFIAASLVISIAAVATVGALGGMSIVTESEFDLLQGFFALVIAGVTALIFYAFGQLIDLNLKNYEVSWQLKEQLEEANDLNKKTVALLTRQMKMMQSGYDLDKDLELRKIEKQLEERRRSLM